MIDLHGGWIKKTTTNVDPGSWQAIISRMVVNLLDDNRYNSHFSIKQSVETCHHQPRKKLYHTWILYFFHAKSLPVSPP